MKCLICGKENEQDAKYCVDCGALLSQPNYDQYGGNTVQEKPYNPRVIYAKPAMILGIVSLASGVICCLGPLSIVVSIVCGLLALIFGILSIKTDKQGQAVTGIVCGIIGLILGVLLVASIIIFQSAEFQQYLYDNYPELWQAIQDAMNQY